MLSILPQKILIPLDAGEIRRRAFRLGARLAQINNATLILLTVIHDTFPYPDIFSFHSPNEDYYHSIRDHAREILKKTAEEAPPGVAIDVMISRGSPAKVIVEVAEEEHVDLIIMTTHNTRGLERAILGSVTDKVLRTAKCPVLVMPMHEAGEPS
jgi:nucleotide-binding universal stress UspA family protein